VASASAGGEGSLARVKQGYELQRQGGGLKLERLETAADPTLSALPHFEDHTEVQGQTPATAWERHMKGFDAVNGPTFGSAPTVSEIHEASENAIWKADYGPRPQTIDYLALIVAALSKLKGHGPPRYFLYTVKRGAMIEPVLREARVPAQEMYLPGAVYEPVGEFADMDNARHAFNVLAEALRKGRFEPAMLATPPPR
jgi:hypothetical protein